MSCHYTTVHCGNMNVVLHPRVASFCPKRMVEMTGNKKWNAADACCWQTLLSSFFCLVSTHSVSLTSGTGWRCCPLRPSTCSSTTRVWAACRWPWLRFTRSSRMKMASFIWPTPPRKCSDTDLQTLARCTFYVHCYQSVCCKYEKSFYLLYNVCLM